MAKLMLDKFTQEEIDSKVESGEIKNGDVWYNTDISYIQYRKDNITVCGLPSLDEDMMKYDIII